MRKEVRFKAVSAFIFFVGVLFGFNDAFTDAQYLYFQDGKTPSFEDQKFHSNAVHAGAPPYSTVDNGGRSFGEVNGVPYFIRVTTVPNGPTDNVVPSRDALHHAEMPQSPYFARNPAVIFFIRSPTPPCGTGRPAEVSAASGGANFRTADESVPSEATDQLPPRVLLRHLLPSTPKDKRFRYARSPAEKGRPKLKRGLDYLAKISKLWHAWRRRSKDPSRGPKLTNKNKLQQTPTENKTLYPHTPPAVGVTPPEDHSKAHGQTSSPPHSETPASPSSPEGPPAPSPITSHHPPKPSFPEEEEEEEEQQQQQQPPPPSPYIHYPSTYPFFPEEQQPLPFPPYSPLSFFPEEQQPSPYPQYTPPPFYAEDQQPLPHLRSPPSTHSSEEKQPLASRRYPSSPFFSEETETYSYPQYPPSPYFLDQLEYPPSPYFPDELEYPPFSQYPTLPYFPDELEYPPFPLFPSWFFFPLPFYPSQYSPLVSFITTNSRQPSAKTPKSHTLGEPSGSNAESLFAKTLSSDGEDNTLSSELGLPCSANAQYMRQLDKAKSSNTVCGQGDNNFIFLSDEEDDSLPNDCTDNKTSQPPRTFYKKFLNKLFRNF